MQTGNGNDFYIFSYVTPGIFQFLFHGSLQFWKTFIFQSCRNKYWFLFCEKFHFIRSPDFYPKYKPAASLDHALVHEFFIRFIKTYKSPVEKKLRPHAAI